MAGDARTPDAPFTGKFKFSVEGVGEIGAFTEVTGLSVEVDVVEIKEGGQNHFSHKVPGRMRWPNIVLKRGVTDSDNLFDWFAKTSGEGFSGEGNALARTQGQVTVLDAKGDPLRAWAFEEAFPVKWTGPTMTASSSEVAIEELEIAHHGFRPA